MAIIVAPNARTSELVINRFYGSHIKSALESGSVVIDVIEANQKRYAELNKP
jgi:hypothetical protein